MFICPPHACLLSKEARRGNWIPGTIVTAVSHSEGAGNWTQVLCNVANALNCWAVFAATVYLVFLLSFKCICCAFVWTHSICLQVPLGRGQTNALDPLEPVLQAVVSLPPLMWELESALLNELFILLGFFKLKFTKKYNKKVWQFSVGFLSPNNY